MNDFLAQEKYIIHSFKRGKNPQNAIKLAQRNLIQSQMKRVGAQNQQTAPADLDGTLIHIEHLFKEAGGFWW